MIIKFLLNMDWNLKMVSNLIHIINTYHIENKYDLIVDIFLAQIYKLKHSK